MSEQLFDDADLFMDVAVQRGQELDKHNEYRTSPGGAAG